MKHERHPTREGTGEEVRPSKTFQWTGQTRGKQLHRWSQAYQEPGPILMCWRASRPENIEDPAVQSMSSAATVITSRSRSRYPDFRSMTNSRGDHVLVNASGTSAAMLCITPRLIGTWMEKKGCGRSLSVGLRSGVQRSR